MITEKNATATEIAITQPKASQLRTILPWSIGAAGLLIYLLTLNHWVSLVSLLQVARVSGWLWQPDLYGPLYWLFTYPIRWLPQPAIPTALNLLAAVCAGLTLTLLARSVMLLPHDRTLDERLREKSEFSLLTTRSAWLPPVLAAIVCGLQLTFWENATAASAEMLDLLCFAYIIRCLLEFRVDGRQSWLTRAALVYGLAIPDNFAMIGFFPLFLLALVWIKGLSFFNLRFLGQMAMFGAAGMLLYLLLPLAQTGTEFFRVPFWQALTANLGTQKAVLATLLNKYALFGAEKPLWILALPSLVPLLLIAIRWPSHFGDTSRIGVTIATVVFNLVYGLFLVFCVWVAFDPPTSPRNYRAGLPQLLTFSFLGALCVGYLAGYFLLVFGTKPERVRRLPPALKLLNTSVVVAVWVVALIAPTMLLYRNLPQIRATNGPQLKNFANSMAQELPRQPAIVLSDDLRELLLLRAITSRERMDNNYLPIQTASMQWADYHRMLHKRYAERWPFDLPKTDNRPVSNGEQKGILEELGRSNLVYYLHPSFGFHFETFYGEPHGLVYKLNPYPEGSLLRPPVTTNLVAENEAFWANAVQTSLVTLLPSVVPPRTTSPTAFVQTLMARAHLPWQTNRDGAVLAGFYSRALNYWGVEMQKQGQLSQAAAHFQRALELNSENLVAQVNLDCNRSLQARRKISGQTAKSVEDAFGKYRNWDQIVQDNGPFDQPTFCYEQGRVFLNFRLFRQAAGALERAKQLAPDNLMSRVWLAKIYVLHDFPEEALKLVNQIHEQRDQITIHRTNVAELVYVEASAHLANNNPKAAENVINTMFEKYPGDDDLTLVAMTVYTAHGLLTNALKAIEQQLKISPTNSAALINKGFYCIKIEDYDQAIAASLKALSLNTNNHSARFNLAIAYLKSDRLDDAQREYETLLKAAPASVPYNYGLAEISYRKRQTNSAIRHYELYLANAPTNTDEAKQVIERLRELSPLTATRKKE